MNTSRCIPRGGVRSLISAVAACWLIAAGTAEAQWSENFDGYAAGSQMHGQGGWAGWDNAPAAGALVSSAQAYSAPNSVAITGGSDLVHQYSGYTSGVWVYRARQYIPSSLTAGSTYFILLNRYAPSGANNSWSIQTVFDLAANTFHDENGTSSTNAIVRNTWVELAYEIDLTHNTVKCFYNNVLFATHAWQSGGVNAIGAVDLYANNVGPVYYDNLSLKPATVVVNTADNSDFSAGKTNLYYAITNCESGDTIAFNIPGPGPHFLQVPAGGLPLIYKKHNLTIDGYTQPGATPNSNPITAANNAVLKIVIDGRNGNGRNMDASTYDGTLAASDPPINNTSMSLERTGYGSTEWGLLGIYRSRNVTVKGLAFLGDDLTTANSVYCIAFEHDYGLNTAVLDPLAYDDGSDRNGHVAGCWFGVNPTNQTADGVVKTASGIAFFRHRDVGTGGTRPELPNEGLVVGVAPGSTNPRSQFNVFAGVGYSLAGEAIRTRVSGNFFGVLPDGVTPYDLSLRNPTFFADVGCLFEIGRYSDTQPIIIGTDGDGVNDADEGNLLGPVGDAAGNTAISLYGTSNKPYIIAGNTFGIGVDGTRWTNAAYFVSSIGINGGTHVQIGSDFDGVSDALEANRIYNNWPITLYPLPPLGNIPFIRVDSSPAPTADAWISVRGNVMVNNGLAPYPWADGSGTRVAAFVAYSAPYLDTTVTFPAIAPLPTLDATNSIFPRLKGTFPVGIAPYTNVTIDVYQLDPEGWANGKSIAGAGSWFAEGFTDSFSFTNGFPQGAKYLGSYPVSNTGSFDVDVTGKDLGPGFVTVAANYSADRVGTHRGRTFTGNFANPIAIIPAGASSVGLAQIVPDVAVWYNTAGYVTNGPVNPAAQLGDNGNWEPYTSVSGDSTFLVAFGTFATDAVNQNFIVVKQPATGGAAKIGYEFFDDSGTPFTGTINLSRVNGNPPRVAADKRYGAAIFITAAETSIGQLAPFQTVSRWSASNPMYSSTNRYVTEQLFTLNPLTLAQTPVTNAWDYVYGPYPATAFGAGADATQNARTGGRPEFLDNGNIVIMIDDKTAFLPGSDGEGTTFAIIKPDGTIVKGPTLVDINDIWDNMAAYRGGFAIRVHNLLYFFDNDGNVRSSIDINASSGLSFGTGRGDASRIGSDIRSHYVYLAGQSPEGGQKPYPVFVAIWDARTGNFVTQAAVCDVDTVAGALTDRVSVGVDALDRFCVAFSYQPTANFAKRQVAARVMAFDGANISYLTPTFFPFVNHESNPNNVLGIETYHPNVSMTPRQILIAAKGTFNGANNPALGPDTVGSETKLYTVLSHPAPVAPVQPTMTVTRSGNNAIVSWQADAGLFVLQATPTLSPAAWTDVAPQPPIVRVGSGDANDKYQMTVPIGSGNVFGRLVRRW
ncbi:MAG TPA: hypothetical protein VJA21_18635 [Verrucomicrobiae bacterium]